jgi:hypothetical protein
MGEDEFVQGGIRTCNKVRKEEINRNSRFGCEKGKKFDLIVTGLFNIPFPVYL